MRLTLMVLLAACTSGTEKDLPSDETDDPESDSEVGEPSLLFYLEFHVENTRAPESEQERMVRDASGAAASAGIPVTFGLGDRFLFDDSATALIEELLADGNAVTLHTGGTLPGTTLDDMVDALAAVPGTHPEVASGTCTWEEEDSGWVEAALGAGLELTLGVVEYCQLTLDPAGPDAAAYEAAVEDGCEGRGPSGCHDPAPTTEPAARRLDPWTTSATATWLQDDGGPMTIVSSYATFGAECAAEGDASECAAETTADAELDLASLAASLDMAVDEAPEAGGTYYITWSTNRIVPTEYVDAWFEGFAAALQDRPSIAATSFP